ncbi:MAG: hypothetical protein IIV81_00170, partial [Clostridia bacterium]|nr:hypothetical protein [Clostridia bacterium]
MIKGVYEIAEHVFMLVTQFEYTHKMCEAYKSEKEPLFVLSTDFEDVSFEREKSDAEARYEGREPIAYSDDYLESLAVLRKFANIILSDGFILFHGSSLSLDGEGYIFTAKSGTGKSTHAHFWRKTFGERVVIINDDKPIIKVKDGKTVVFGSPWNGKHNIGNNISAPLKALSILHRGEKNRVEKTDKNDAFGMLLQQTYRPNDSVALAKLLPLIDNLAESVALYNIYCNLDDNTA